MGATLTEKIIARAAGRDTVQAGDEVWATPDRVMMNDSSGPRRIAGLIDELGGVAVPDRVVLAADHFTPAATPRHAEILDITRRWAAANPGVHYFEGDGILHNLMLERGLVAPGMLVTGADSHSTSAGAAGAVSVAVGSTELATIICSERVWLRVPDTIRIDLDGNLGAYVDMRDVTMRLLGDHGFGFADYLAVEYAGSFTTTLSLENRLVLSNQGIEMGAKNAIVEPDGLASDPDATFLARHRYTIDSLVPLVALHPAPDHVVPAAEADSPIDVAWMGSCVGGRLADLHAAAHVLKTNKVRVRTLVTPSTAAVYREALDDGTLAVLAEAGCVIQPPGCGACAGLHSGVVTDGERVIATGTRNFPGRMGARSAEITLASGYTWAASAIAGRIVDPREVTE